MHRSLLSWLVLGATVVTAFKDTSPFVLFSTSEILATPPQITTASSLSNLISEELHKCPSDTYLFVRQPGVSATDFRDPKAFPHLRRWLSGDEKRIRSSFTVTDVLGDLDIESMRTSVEAICRAKTRTLSLKLPPITPGSSEEAYDNGRKLDSIINDFPSPNFTVIYTTSPVVSSSDLPDASFHMDSSSRPKAEEPSTYEMEDPLAYEVEKPYAYSSHLEMKRDLSARASNSTRDTRPLFEKYQFFTPGIFMGLVVAFILLPILYVAISAVASLEVSYAAFDKEMGPTAQQKHKQQ